MRKQLAVFLAIVLIGALGFLSLPIGGVTINPSSGYLSISTNVALAVNTLPPDTTAMRSYNPSGGNQSFFPIDPVEVNVSAASVWTGVNVSSYTPSGITGAILHLVNTGSSAYYLGIRNNSSTDQRVNQLSAGTHCWAAMGVDSNRTFEVYTDNTTAIDIYLVGYTMAGVTFFTNGIVKSTADLNAWTDMNCSAEAPGAIGLIFEIQAISAGGGAGLRMEGSTDNRLYPIYLHDTFSAIIGCNASQFCQFYHQYSQTVFYLVGYITDGCTFNTNATDVSLNTTDSWLDLSALPANATMGFIEVTGTNYNYGLRENGSTENIYYSSIRHPWGFVECDTNGIIEGEISNTACDFFVVGYATKLGVNAPTVTNGIGATNATTTSATLNGNLTDDGSENCTVSIYWGTSDGVTNSSNWTNNETIGTQASGIFYKDIANLTLNTTYYYRCYASNSAGSDWADSTSNFTTLEIAISNTPPSYDFGTVNAGSTYSTGLTAFNITNTGDVPVNISIGGTNMTGGATWVLNDTATPGADIYGLKAGISGTELNQSFFPIDPTEYTPTLANAWVEVDLDNYIDGLGSNITGVILHCVNTNNTYTYALGLRKNNSSDNRTSKLYSTTHCWAAIGVDSSNIFEAYVGNTTYIDIYIVGYTKTGVTFFDNAYNKTPTTLNDWTNIDCHTEAPNAIGLIFEVNTNDEVSHYFGLRKNGSSDNRVFPAEAHCCFGFIIGCDANQTSQGYIDNPTLNLYLVGYITDGAIFNTFATDVSLSTTYTWLNLPALPTNSVMGFIEVAASSCKDYGFRKNGSTEDIHYFADLHPSAFVECDTNYITEGYIGSTGIDFFVVGYATDGGYNTTVRLNSPYNNLCTNLEVNATQGWGLELYTPTSYSDGYTKSGVVTLTATEA